LDELKTLGAHNVSRERPAGLGGRRALLGMLRAYEQWRDVEGRVPATYEVIFGVLEKR
jgi:malonyl-CoA O-methyltransferase